MPEEPILHSPFSIFHLDAAASLAGTLIIGGMTVTSVYIAAAKTNNTQQVGGDLSNTNDVGQVEGDTNVLSGVVQGRARSPSAP